MTDNNDGRTPLQPLTPQDVAMLRQNLKNIQDVLDGIAKAEKAGVKMDDQKAQALSAKEQINKLLAVYG